MSYISEASRPAFDFSYFSNNNSPNDNRAKKRVLSVQYSMSKQKRWQIPKEVEESFEKFKSHWKHVQIVRTGDDQRFRWYSRERNVSVKDSNGFNASSNAL